MCPSFSWCRKGTLILTEAMRRSPLGFGEPAPWFQCRTTQNPTYVFDTVAGRFIVLCFFGSAADAESKDGLAGSAAQRARFDDQNLCFFGVSTDPEDERLAPRERSPARSSLFLGHPRR